MDRERLLFISPVLPSITGNGLAMRAYRVVEALGTRYRVSLLVVSQRPAFDESAIQQIRDLCDQVVVQSTSSTRRRLLTRYAESRTQFSDVSFDIIHVFRLAMVEHAEVFLTGTAKCHLDLDDVESTTQRRLADLYDLNGFTLPATEARAAAHNCQLREDQAFAHFDRIYVCSALDAIDIRQRSPADVRVLPNVVGIAHPVVRTPTAPLTFLFVGTFGYYPNVDAIVYFCTSILPRLRAAMAEPFRVLVVGTGSEEMMPFLQNVQEVEVIGAVRSVDEWYAAADVVVVPVRAGGGTRIKVLEAFSHGVPVVSTSLGVEGIEACHGEHVLLGDTPEAFAQGCISFMRNPSLRNALTQHAGSLVRDHYTPERLAAIVTALP